MRAVAANFKARHHDVELAIPLNLPFETVK